MPESFIKPWDLGEGAVAGSAVRAQPAVRTLGAGLLPPRARVGMSSSAQKENMYVSAILK